MLDHSEKVAQARSLTSTFQGSWALADLLVPPSGLHIPRGQFYHIFNLGILNLFPSVYAWGWIEL